MVLLRAMAEGAQERMLQVITGSGAVLEDDYGHSTSMNIMIVVALLLMLSGPCFFACFCSAG